MHYAWRREHTTFAEQDKLTKPATFPEQTVKYMITHPRDQVDVLNVHWLLESASLFHKFKFTAIALEIVSSEFLVVQMLSEAGTRISRDHILESRLFQHHRILLKLYSHLGLHLDTLYSYFFYKCFIYTSKCDSKVPEEMITNPCLW